MYRLDTISQLLQTGKLRNILAPHYLTPTVFYEIDLTDLCGGTVMNGSHLIEAMQLDRIIICIERADVLKEMTWKKRQGSG